MYTLKIAIIFDHSRLRLKKDLNKQNNPVAHWHHRYKVNWTTPKYNFMPQITVIRHGSPRRQPIYTFLLIACIPLSEKKKIRPYFFVVDKFSLNLPTNLVACKAAFYTFCFLYITSEVNTAIRPCFLSYRHRTECSFSQLCKTNCTHWIYSGW